MTTIELAGRDVVAVRAANPGPFTLGGTNTWIVGRDLAWLVDPGPSLEPHVEAVSSELISRGGLGGVAVTHDHLDHVEALPAIRDRFPDAPVAGARGAVDLHLTGGSVFGPFEAVGTPGHSPDHLAFIAGDVAFTGDAVLGEGSVFIAPDQGALSAYLDALVNLRRRPLAVLAPGHGPPVYEPGAKIDEYIAHRLDRERRLLAALAAGKRTVDELLDDAWDDAPRELRPAAAVTLAAHLDKLDEEGRLPEGVERPQGS